MKLETRIIITSILKDNSINGEVTANKIVKEISELDYIHAIYNKVSASECTAEIVKENTKMIINMDINGQLEPQIFNMLEAVKKDIRVYNMSCKQLENTLITKLGEEITKLESLKNDVQFFINITNVKLV